MKVMFASDIHGSASACRKMLEIFNQEQASRLVLLGDLLYHGPRNPLPDGYAPMEVAEMLNAVKTSLLCVRGNCDAEVDQMVLDFPMRADYALLDLDGHIALITHGHLYDPDQFPVRDDAMAYVQGHTHVAAIKPRNNYIFLNPGSVALPKNGPASYMIYENGCFEIRDLEGQPLKTYSLDEHART